MSQRIKRGMEENWEMGGGATQLKRGTWEHKKEKEGKLPLLFSYNFEIE